MATIPGIKKRPFYLRQWLHAAVVGPGTALATATTLAAACNSKNPSTIIITSSSIALFFAVVAFVLNIAKGAYQDRHTAAHESPNDIEGCLWVIYHKVAVRRKPDGGKLPRDELRLTVHRVIEEQLEQVIPYVCNGQDVDRDPGRKFSKRSGIIGRAALTGNTLVATRKAKDEKQFVAELAKEWSVPSEEARKLKPDRWSWMAVPIKDNHTNQVIGVLFADSSEPSFFTDDIQEDIIACCAGLTTFVECRYGKVNR